MSQTPENQEKEESLLNIVSPSQDEQENQSQAQDEANDKSPDFHVEMRRLEEEKKDLTDRLLRTHAEMENLRKRTQRDMKDARQYAMTNFARDMLSVHDNLDRALSSLPDTDEGKDAKAQEAAISALIEGVAMTKRELNNVFERHGIQSINPEGEAFDANFHQAMFEVPNESVARNTILEVVQTGFKIAERVLRPAMVGVSKGGPRRNMASSETSAPNVAYEEAAQKNQNDNNIDRKV